jgi:ligand-binding SRPBCC domain-containing protein
VPVIEYEIFVEAPVDVCFDLARDVEIHTKTTLNTKERAVGGITKGLLEEGDSVTWEAVHLGVKQRLTAKIIKMDKPNSFVDVMVKGAFHSFTHTHLFIAIENGTIMKDRFDYKSPLGILGIIADKCFLERYMRNFIISRSKELKKIAENM